MGFVGVEANGVDDDGEQKTGVASRGKTGVCDAKTCYVFYCLIAI
jgi:hypothetical protein